MQCNAERGTGPIDFPLLEIELLSAAEYAAKYQEPTTRTVIDVLQEAKELAVVALNYPLAAALRDLIEPLRKKQDS